MNAKLFIVALVGLALAEKDSTIDDMLKMKGDMAQKAPKMTDESKFFEDPKEGEEFPELTEEGAGMVVMAAAEAVEAIEGFDDLSPPEKEAVALATADTIVNMMDNFGIDSDEKLDEAASEFEKVAKEEEAKEGKEEMSEEKPKTKRQVEPEEEEFEECPCAEYEAEGFDVRDEAGACLYEPEFDCSSLELELELEDGELVKREANKTAEETVVEVSKEKPEDRNAFDYPDYPSSSSAFAFSPFNLHSLTPRSARRLVFLRNLAAHTRVPPFLVMQAFNELDFPFGPLGFARSAHLLSQFRADEQKPAEEIKPGAAGIFEADGTIVPEIADEIDEVAKEVFDEMKAEEAEFDEEFEEFTSEEEKAIIESMKDGMIDTLAAMMIDTEAMEEFEKKAEEKVKEEEAKEDKEPEVSDLDRQDGFGGFHRPRTFAFGPRGFGFGGRRQFFRNFFPFFVQPPFFFRQFGGFGGRGFGGHRGFGGRF